ncbi:MAG: hypothetical protein ABIZ80_20110, partial [Bryobacteraceae bacterium]
MGRDLALAVSLANLCYLRIWSELLTYKRQQTYHMKTPPLPAEMLAALVNVLVLAALFFAIARFLRPRAPKLLEWGFLLFLAVPLNAIRSVLSNQFPLLKSPLFEAIGPWGVFLVGLTVGVTSLVILLRWTRQTAKLAGTVLSLLLPFTAVTFGQALWAAAHFDPAPFANKPAAPRLAVDGKAPRVLWIIFDEWDQRLTFDEPRADLPLPELARFRSQALFVDNALAPGTETPVSIPALTTGRPVSGGIPVDPREYLVSVRDTREAVHWGSQPNVFSRARERGVNSGIAGWFHPYCRLFGDSAASCSWYQM